MRVTCPACAASYEVPDRMIGPEGRRLRCAKCAEQWLALPASGPAIEAPPAAPARPAPPPAAESLPARPPDRPEAPRATTAEGIAPAAAPQAHAAPRRPPRVIEPPLPPLGDAAPRAGRVALALAWLGTGLFVLALGAALAVFRAEIVETWPPAARLYQAIGVPG